MVHHVEITFKSRGHPTEYWYIPADKISSEVQAAMREQEDGFPAWCTGDTALFDLGKDGIPEAAMVHGPYIIGETFDYRR